MGSQSSAAANDGIDEVPSPLDDATVIRLGSSDSAVIEKVEAVETTRIALETASQTTLEIVDDVGLQDFTFPDNSAS